MANSGEGPIGQLWAGLTQGIAFIAGGPSMQDGVTWDAVETLCGRPTGRGWSAADARAASDLRSYMTATFTKPSTSAPAPTARQFPPGRQTH